MNVEAKVFDFDKTKGHDLVPWIERIDPIGDLRVQVGGTTLEFSGVNLGDFIRFFNEAMAGLKRAGEAIILIPDYEPTIWLGREPAAIRVRITNIGENVDEVTSERQLLEALRNIRGEISKQSLDLGTKIKID